MDGITFVVAMISLFCFGLVAERRKRMDIVVITIILMFVVAAIFVATKESSARNQAYPSNGYAFSFTQVTSPLFSYTIAS